MSGLIIHYDSAGAIFVPDPVFATNPLTYVVHDDILSASRTFYDSAGRVSYTVEIESPGGAATGPMAVVTADDVVTVTRFNYDEAGRQTGVAQVLSFCETGCPSDDPNAWEDDPLLIHPATGLTLTPTEFYTTQYAYDDAGRQTQVTDAREKTTQYEYDGLGRLVQTTVDDGTITHTEYDHLGRRVAEVAQHDPSDLAVTAAELTTHYEYDDTGRLRAVILPPVEHPAGNIGLVRPRYEYTYDIYGNQTAQRDNIYQIDTGPDAGIYYDHGASPIDPANPPAALHDTRLTTWAYDALGAQLSRTLPLGNVTSPASPFTELFEYDDFGRLERHVDFEGRTVDSAYDALGRLGAQEFFEIGDDPDVDPPAEIFDYVYDALGREVKVVQDLTTGDRITERTYDEFGRVTMVDSPEGTIHYEYDGATGLLTRTWTGADAMNIVTATDYSYDVLGRLATVTADWRGGVDITDETTTYIYDEVGNLSIAIFDADATDLQNETIVSLHTYDNLNRLTVLHQFVDTDADNVYDSGTDTPLAEYTYTLRADGKRVAAEESEWLTDGSENETAITWSYDNAGRLIEESYNSHDHNQDFIAGYKYDLVGNRLEKQVDTDPTFTGASIPDVGWFYTYDANDRLTTEVEFNGTQFIQTKHYYGNEGAHTTPGPTTQLTSSERIKLTDADFFYAASAYEYDLRGRLETVTTTDYQGDGETVDSQTVVDYTYSTGGIRVSAQTKVDTDGNGTFNTDSTTLYLIDELNPTGYAKPIEEHIDGNLDRSYVIGHQIITQTNHDTASAHHFLQDGHGRTRALLDGAAVIVELYAYDAFGETLAASHLAVADSALTTWLVGDGQYDPGSKLVNHIARWRNGHRFLTLDSYVGNNVDPLSLHKYLYVHSDPINGIDPTGKFFATISTAVANGIGSLMRSSRVGAALATLDRVSTISDAAQLIAQFAATGTVNPVQAAGLAAAIFPFGRVLGAVNVVGNRLTGVAEGLTDVRQALVRAKLGGNKLAQTVGDFGAFTVATKLGWNPTSFPVRYHGIDGIFEQGGRLLIVEAKGGASHALRHTQHGQQLSQRWIQEQIRKLGRIDRAWANRLDDAARSGKLDVMFSRTPIDGDRVLDPVFEIRNYASVGFDRFKG